MKLDPENEEMMRRFASQMMKEGHGNKSGQFFSFEI